MVTERDYGFSSYNRFLQGDNSALEEFFMRYGDSLVRFAYCYLKNADAAEDAVQDAFVSVLLRRKRFSACDNFRAYVYKTVRNKCLDYLRFKKRQLSLDGLENVLVSSADAEREYCLKERDERLYACLQALPTQYSEVLFLVYVEGYRAEGASKVLGKTKKQTYNLLARAKTALKERLEKESFTYEIE
jgi:RNA polymerase sigma-70 factor (ECF subfamily)